MVRIVRVLADLDDTEEAVSIVAKLAEHFGIDLESHGTTLSPQLLVLVLQLLLKLEVVAVVETNVEDVPLLAVRGSLEVPAAGNVGGRVAIAKGVMRRDALSIHAEVNSEEGVLLVLCAAVSH